MATHTSSRRLQSLAGLFCIVMLLVGILPITRVHGKRTHAQAKTTSPLAILAAVNALRATRGLKAYTVDSQLMAYAQEHSEYQAQIHTSTHQRRDGSTAFANGIEENVASGGLGWITPEFAVYQIWQDAIHMKTMVNFSGGAAGIGVANDGQDEYYTLDVRPAGSVSPTKTGKKTTGSQTPTKPIPLVPLVTMTVRPNGCTVHVVGYGQSLWAIAIAYGVHINDIRGLNGIAADSTDIYAGQKLLIRCVTLMPTSPSAETSIPFTVTPEATKTWVTDTPSPAPTEVGAAATSAGAIPDTAPAAGPPPALIAGLLILTGGTLLVVLAFTLIKRQ